MVRYRWGGTGNYFDDRSGRPINSYVENNVACDDFFAVTVD